MYLCFKQTDIPFITMNSDTINVRDIKKMRLERHWSQEQLAAMSGLSIRTIQRIEKGENAGLESLKALAAVFEITIEDTDTNKEVEQARIEEEYVQNVKGFYKLLFIAILSLMPPLYFAIQDAAFWNMFLWFLVSWGVLLGIYSLNAFDFFGEAWKQKIIDRKFKK